MSEFIFEPSPHVPFRDVAAIEKARRIRRADIDRHPNPDYKIHVVPDPDVEMGFVADMFMRIRRSAEAGRRLVMILPNPCPPYRHVAHLINTFQVDCRHVWAFAMDEYADQDGRVAPRDWRFGFGYSMMDYFYSRIDERLRPPEEQFVCFTDGNLGSYGRMIADVGGADVVYCGPGWTGHLAFIEPDAPEFDAPLEEWRALGPRIVTLSPFTLAQNSLHGSFGKSGDLAAVPPKAATIGPAEVVQAKLRRQTIALTVHGTSTSWQRLVGRLVMHGPVTPKVPESICQTLRTDCYVSETNAQDIEPDWAKGY